MVHENLVLEQMWLSVCVSTNSVPVLLRAEMLNDVIVSRTLTRQGNELRVTRVLSEAHPHLTGKLREARDEHAMLSCYD